MFIALLVAAVDRICFTVSLNYTTCVLTYHFLSTMFEHINNIYLNAPQSTIILMSHLTIGVTLGIYCTAIDLKITNIVNIIDGFP